MACRAEWPTKRRRGDAEVAAAPAATIERAKTSIESALVGHQASAPIRGVSGRDHPPAGERRHLRAGRCWRCRRGRSTITTGKPLAGDLGDDVAPAETVAIRRAPRSGSSRVRRCRRSRRARRRRLFVAASGGSEADADAGRRAGGRWTSPGISVMPGESVAMIVGISKIRRLILGILAQVFVDEATDAGGLDVDLVLRHRPRPHRAEGVLRLADQPLAVATLHVARGHIVDDGVAPDVLVGVGLAMPRPPLPMITASSPS